MIEEKLLDTISVIDESKEKFEYSVWQVGPIWLIDYYSKSTVGWYAYDSLEEVRQAWCEIADMVPEELVF
jgi:hypothetical protein